MQELSCAPPRIMEAAHGLEPLLSDTARREEIGSRKSRQFVLASAACASTGIATGAVEHEATQKGQTAPSNVVASACQSFLIIPLALALIGIARRYSLAQRRRCPSAMLVVKLRGAKLFDSRVVRFNRNFGSDATRPRAQDDDSARQED